MANIELVTAADVPLMQGLAQRVTAVRPDLVNADLASIDEAHQVTVMLGDGRSFRGFPDSRQSKQGYLVLLGRSSERPRQTETHGPFSVDEIAAVMRA